MIVNALSASGRRSEGEARLDVEQLQLRGRKRSHMDWRWRIQVVIVQTAKSHAADLLVAGAGAQEDVSVFAVARIWHRSESLRVLF